MSLRPTALITGVGGQDGIYLAHALVADGYRVVGTVLPGSTGEARLAVYAPEVERVRLDVRDADALTALVEVTRPAEIYHLAAFSSVGRSWSEPELTFASNLTPGATLLDAIVGLGREGVRTRLFQASSAEALAGTSPYAESKAQAATLIADACRDRGVLAAVGVLYNHESPLRGEQFVTRKITRAAAEIALGRAETVTLGNLEVGRDWGFAGDYVEAMRHMLAAAEPLVLPIGTGVAHTLRELVEVAFAAAGVADPWDRVLQSTELLRPADTAVQVADVAPARRHLGWSARTPFETVVEHMVAVDLERLRSGVAEESGYLAPRVRR